jgi:formylglycine-generating enzyme required for sulfatase activity
VVANSIGIRLVLIPAGRFMMGNGHTPDEELEAFKPYTGGSQPRPVADEYPQHTVRITRPFYIGAYNVTVGQFRRFVKETGYKTEAETGSTRSPVRGADGWDPQKKAFIWKADYSWRKVGFRQTDEHPVVDVSWDDAVAFCRWLSRKEGKVYRLPTEAEWEYACRAGTTTRYYSGDDPESLAKVGNVADAAAKAMFPTWTWTINGNDGYVFTAPVGSFRPNAFGLYDMHGNASQWCADWYDEKYYGVSPKDDPIGPDSPKGGRNNSDGRRVVRGSDWMTAPSGCRSAARCGLTPVDRFDFVGFRVARDADKWGR